MAEDKRGLLSIGVFFLILVAAILLGATQIMSWGLFFPVVFVLFGLWLLALSAMQRSSPQKYERTAFSTLSLGLVLVAVGGAWYLFAFSWLYSLVVVLLALGVLAVAAALKRS
ncbi:MAG: hypothetical protein NWF04_09115 [Candidatus Bathyarchaeota archaeon]|nr:hypothetical protein [Candidatus Bathyarchaeota archaeon]